MRPGGWRRRSTVHNEEPSCQNANPLRIFAATRTSLLHHALPPGETTCRVPDENARLYRLRLPRRPPMKPPGSNQRTRGTVRMWDDEKGFGFIEPAEGGADVFLHMKAFGENTTRPVEGAPVTYCLTTDETGRPRAAFARLESGARQAEPTFRPLPMPVEPRYVPAPQHRRQAPRRLPSVGWAFIGSAGFIGALAGAAHFHYLGWWVPAVYGAASSVTFIAYALDKARAVDAEWRVSENTLHLLEFLGGWPGALFAQQCLRHKTAKPGYQAIFWLIVAAHLGLWAWWIVRQSQP